MVEYALILVGSSFNTIGSVGTVVGSWLSNNWGALSYGLLALVALRIAFWAFRSDH